MIVTILYWLGLGWMMTRTVYWVVHLWAVIGALWLLYEKRYLVGWRGAGLAFACCVDWGTGLVIGLLLPTLRELPEAGKGAA